MRDNPQKHDGMMNTPKNGNIFKRPVQIANNRITFTQQIIFQHPFEIHQLMNQEPRQNDLAEGGLSQHLHRHHDGNEPLVKAELLNA